jgi:hypothetical protein
VQWVTWYAPSFYAKTEELIELCKVAAEMMMYIHLHAEVKLGIGKLR